MHEYSYIKNDLSAYYSIQFSPGYISFCYGHKAVTVRDRVVVRVGFTYLFIMVIAPNGAQFGLKSNA